MYTPDGYTSLRHQVLYLLCTLKIIFAYSSFHWIIFSALNADLVIRRLTPKGISGCRVGWTNTLKRPHLSVGLGLPTLQTGR